MSIVHNGYDCTSELSIVTSFSSIELEYVCLLQSLMIPDAIIFLHLPENEKQ